MNRITVAKLTEELMAMCHQHNADPEKVEVNYRLDHDEDVEPVGSVEEDLFADDNRTLTAVCLIGADLT